MAQALQDIISGLQSVYQPQKDLVQSQLSALPAYYQAQQAGLDQTKTNAFNDISSGANARGVLYSGVPIDEQAKYVGEKYLPAVAGLQQDQTNKTFALQDSLNKINTQQYSQAQDTYNAQLKAEQDAAARVQAAQIAAASRVGSGTKVSAGASRRQEYDDVTTKIQDLARQGHSYGDVAQILRDNGLNPSNYDQALRSTFVPQNFDPAQQDKEIQAYLRGY